MVDRINAPKQEVQSPTLSAYSKETRIQHELAALNQVAVAIGGARSEPDVYDLVTHTLSGLGCSAAVLVFGQDAQHLTVEACSTPPPRLVGAIERLAGFSLTGYQFPLDHLDFCQPVLKKDQSELFELGTEYFARLIPDSDPHLLASIARRVGLDWGIAAPLKVDKQIVGVLVVAREDLVPEDIPIITAFAIQTSAGIENIRLIRSARHQREVAETLRQVAILINASLDLDTVLDRILEQLAQVVDYDSTSLMLVEGDKLSMRAIRGFEEPEHVLEIASDIADNRLFQEMTTSRLPIVISDVKVDERYRHWAGAYPVRSWIGVPLVVRDRVIGQLAVDKHHPNYYDEDDAELVLAFAQQAASAIENARLYQAERDRRQEIEVVQYASLSLTTSLGLPQVLDSILEAALNLVAAQNAHVFLYSEGRLTYGAALWADGSREGPVADPRPNGLTYSVALQGETILIPDMHTHPLYAEVSQDWGGSIVGLPLKIGERVVGVMNVSRSESGPFSDAELRVLRQLADHAAIAIENARLFEAEQHQREMAETLHRSALALTSTMALDQVFERILSELQNVVPYDSASVQLLKEDQLEIIGGRGFPNLSELLGVSFPARGDNPNALVLDSGEPIIIDDVSPRYAAFSQEPHTAADIHGWMGVPLLIGNQAIGMLALDKHQPNFYNETYARTAMAYAAQAAIAIENAQLHQTLQDYAAELESRVETRTHEVNREHERLLTVLENAGEAIAIANAEGIVQYANPAWERLTGHSATQAIQQQERILNDKIFPDLLVTVHNVTYPQQHIWHKEIVGQRPDGATYVVDLAITPVFDDAKELVNLVAIYRDVTQYKELDRIKSEFLSTAAHELRSPLTSILGFSELLLNRQDLSAEEHGRFLEYIYDHAIHLRQLVSDLLDISRIESGSSSDVKFAPLDLYPLFEEEIQSWRKAHPDHNYQLHIESGQPQVHADKDRISQVIRNLLSNATKYSSAGSTVILGASPLGGFMEVTVSDEGIGMAPEELTHIFEKFWRADASSTALEGTGLGLVIVKHIVEQHGGHIWVDSTKGKGTTVHFTLPMVERQTTVLIVEDEDSVRDIEHRILNSNGIATLMSSNGQQGVEMAETHLPDLILLDLMMPGMSGQDVLHVLKSNPATQHIPVLVVSARSSLQTIEESYALGAVDFLTKPFEYHELLSRVRRALRIAASSR
jgi:PAS domain S-box-containing protein